MRPHKPIASDRSFSSTPLPPQADKITALTNAAGVEVEPIWATLLVKALEGKNIKDLLSNVGAGGGAPAAGAPVAASGGAGGSAPAAEEKKAAPKEEEKEESDDDMVRHSRLKRFQESLAHYSSSSSSAGFRLVRLNATTCLFPSLPFCYYISLKSASPVLESTRSNMTPASARKRNITAGIKELGMNFARKLFI